MTIVKWKRGKILKIKKGYNPNCSSGLYVLLGLIFATPIVGGVIFSLISSKLSKILYKRHMAKYGKKEIVA